jgi:predicted N-acyltransferase
MSQVLDEETVSIVESYAVPGGRVSVVAADAMKSYDMGETELAGQSQDHRYLQVVAETLQDDFAMQYFVFHDASGRFRGAQPFFIINQSLVTAMKGAVALVTAQVRRVFPRFLTMRTLMVGNPAGWGCLGAASVEDREWMGAALHEVLAPYARRQKVSLVVLKDFLPEFRATLAPFTSNGYARIASMPMTCLPLDYANFDDYMQKTLSKATRKNLRRKFRDSEEAGGKLTMEVVRDITPVVEEAYPLYVQVYERAKLKFEKLTKEYLCRLGQDMPDRARFFLWRREGKLVAMSVCIVKDHCLYDLYIGMDYPLAHDMQLYFITLRDVLSWCIESGVKMYFSTPLNYDSKLHMKCDLVPQDLYVMHTSRLLNPIFKRAIRLAGPTRQDPLIKKFRNAHEL